MLTVQLMAFLATMGMQEKIWEVDEESFVNLASKWTCIYRGFNLKLLCLSCFSRIWLLKAVNLTQWNSSIRVFAFLTPLSILWYYSQTVEERNLQSAFSTLNPNHNRDLLLMFYSFQGDIIHCYRNLWSMWSFWLVFCDCSFHSGSCRTVVLDSSVWHLMDECKRLVQASWWEGLAVGKAGSCFGG